MDRWTLRQAPLVGAVLATFAAAIACSSGAGPATRSSSARPSSADTAAFGITVPPIYVTPPGTVVPGPSSCPADFATTLRSAAPSTHYQLSAEIDPHVVRCDYKAVPAGTLQHGQCSAATVIVNTEPQAFKDFNRWNVETGQNSMWTNNPPLRPTPIDGIGILAEWVPALLELGTGNDTTWVSVTLTCPGDTAAVLALAKRLAIQGIASSA